MREVYASADMALQQLDPDRILETAVKLELRIVERFPESGLSKVCSQLVELASQARATCEELRRPNLWLRVGSTVLILFALSALVGGIALALGDVLSHSQLTWADAIQVSEAAVNDVILLGASIYFFLTLERRYKRGKVERALYQLRTLAHLVDVHQLTKSPDMAGSSAIRTANSPKRMGRFQMGRYLDYCSEMLALSSIIAALYGEGFDDPEAVGAVTRVEDLCHALQRKIWQKVVLLRGTGMPEDTA